MDTSQIEQRFKTHVRVRCQKYGSPMGSNMIMNNISKTGGCLSFVTISSEYKKGDIIRLTVDLEAVKRMRIVNAEVIWQKGGTIGVVFLPPETVVNKLLDRR